MIAVFIASLIEQAVRNHVAQTGKQLQGLMPDKRDNLAPTARKILTAFESYAWSLSNTRMVVEKFIGLD